MFTDQFKIQVKTFFGFEEILAQEIQALGGANIKTKNRLVECFGDLGFLYKLNFSLRTALRILVPIAEFNAKNETHLYKNLIKIPWDLYLKPEQTFLVDSTVYSDFFTNSHFVALKTKDAIVDFFQENNNQRPSVNKDSPDVRFNLYIGNEKVILSLDSSGESLHRRGYRIATGNAPINEVLAAGVLKLAGWDGSGNFLDPMCGSGTLPIEAAMMAMNLPPQIHRASFAFQNWRNYDSEMFKFIQSKRMDKIKDFNGTILGYDKDEKMVKLAKENIQSVDLEDFITIEQKDFFASKKNLFPVQIVFNPPYNERLKQTQSDFYQQIGSTLKHHYPNTLSAFITSDLNARKQVGLRPNKRIKLYNGKLECDFLMYETYEGSKKAKKQKESANFENKNQSNQ